MGIIAPRRLVHVFLITLLIILTTAYYVASLKDAVPSPKELVSTVGDKLKGVSQIDHDALFSNSTDDTDTKTETKNNTEKEAVQQASSEVSDSATWSSYYDTAATAESEKGNEDVGRHFHVRPTPPISKDLGVPGCEYPILIHTSPDKHCTGSLALYASIVRNTLTQPEALANKTCVHFTYVDEKLETLEEMYQWPARKNPFTNIDDCAKLDSTPALNDLVPVRWQALVPIEKPKKMKVGHAAWLLALNKVHSWAFDLYPRVLILDADSFIITDLHNIFLETPRDTAIAGASDQYHDCQDRSRMNGGMILLGAPGRYFHMVISELLYDPNASCMSGRWEQSEQELLNCFCGYTYTDRPVLHLPRPEFTCRMMPIYNSVWPKNYGCSDVNVMPIRSIHFTAVTKSWDVPEDKLDDRFDTKFYKCLRDNGRSANVKKLEACSIPQLEETREFDDSVADPN